MQDAMDDADKINLSEIRIMLEEESSKRVFHCNAIKCMHWNRFRCRLHEVELNKDGACSRRMDDAGESLGGQKQDRQDERKKGNVGENHTA